MANPNPNYPPYGGSQGGYGAPQAGAPPGGYGAPQSGAPHGGYGAPQPGAAPGGYGAPPHGAPSGGYGAPPHGAPSGGYGAPPHGAPPHGAPQGGYGAAQPGAPPGGYGAPHSGAPSSGYGAPQPGAPSSGYGAPHSGAPPSSGYPGAPSHGAPGGWGGSGGAAGAPPGIDPQVHQWFVSVDADHSGRINMSELQQALTNANWTHFNAETCRLMIGLFDRDQSGQIELHEFQALWNYITQWKSTFEQFDRDRSGAIDANELHTAFNQMGYRVTPQFAQLVVYRYDPLAKQRLTLDNFIQACVLLKTVTDTFRQKDSQMKGVIQLSYEDFLTLVLLNKQ